MAHHKVFEITLQLIEIEHLFRKPEISPLSQEYKVYSYIAGIEYISNELYANPSYEAVKLRLELPADQIAPGLAVETRAAIRRYCQGRLKDVGHDIHALRWRGLRALGMGFISLFVLIIASRLVFEEANLIRQVISEGLSIAAWVSLWVPLEILIFRIWEHRLDKKVYTLLAELELEIVPSK